MIIEKLVVGPLSANCYIVRIKELDLVIDPGGDAGSVMKYFDLNGFRPDLILNTHGHFDHIGAVPELLEKYGIDFFIDPGDEEIITDPVKNGSSIFGENNLSLKTYNLIDADDIEYFRKKGIEIIKTPGHSAGSIVIGVENYLFTGDFLFKGSIGRTDLVGGNVHDMKKSLIKIKKMDDRFKVFPGHGPETDLKYEKKNNYYLGDNILF